MSCIKTVNDYILIKIIGKGNYGEVYLTQKTNYPQYFATKQISKADQNMIKYLNYELSILKELRHPNIVGLIDIMESANNIYIVMEYCNGGSLSNALQRYGKPFPVQIIQYIMRQIVEGLKYIHSRRIIHRDIKLDNILVNYKTQEDLNNNNLLASEVKIIDFGLATRLGPNGYAYTFIGSPINMDPKILGGVNENGQYEQLQGYNEKADIWSLGTICYQMLTGQVLYKVDTFEELLQKVKSGHYSIPTKIELSNEIILFLNSMLQYEGEYRASAEELSLHPFLTKDVRTFTKFNLNSIHNKINGSKIDMNPMNNGTIVRAAIDSMNNNNNWMGCNMPQQYQNNYLDGNKNVEIRPTGFNVNNLNLPRNEISNAFNDTGNDKVKIRPTNPNDNNVNDTGNDKAKIRPTFTNDNYSNSTGNDKGNIRPTFTNDNNFDGLEKDIFIENGDGSKKSTSVRNTSENYTTKRTIRDSEEEIKELERIEKLLSDCKKNEQERNEIKKRQETRMKRNNNLRSENKNFEINNNNNYGNYLNGLLTEYSEAKKYFRDNDLKNKEKDAYNKSIQIQKLISQQRQDTLKNDLPSPVTPEYIYDCSVNDRNNKFTEIINYYNQKKKN